MRQMSALKVYASLKQLLKYDTEESIHIHQVSKDLNINHFSLPYGSMTVNFYLLIGF